ncbi:MAG: hypothetical protein Q9164_002390 [Protoblastenia rupestris]
MILQRSSSWQNPRILSGAFVLVLLIIALYTINPSLERDPEGINVDEEPSRETTTKSSSSGKSYKGKIFANPKPIDDASRKSQEKVQDDGINRADRGNPWHEEKLHSSTGQNTAKESTWRFDVKKDGTNYGLSELQCSTAFPKLYADIDSMVESFKIKSITKEQIDSQSLQGPKFKAMIYDGELFLLSDQGLEEPNTRGMATIHAINRALVAYPDRRELPNIEFVIYTQDGPPGEDPIWGYTKKSGRDYDNIWMIPDFGFYGWPEPKVGSYGEVRRQIKDIENDLPFDQKIKKLVWRGTVFEGHQQREAFIEATNNKTWADVASLNWFDKESIKKNVLSIPDHCKYMFVGHISGSSWSAQGKYMHNCHSVFVTHELEWAEVYDSVLVDSGPEQNYVKAKDDWSDLEVLMKDLLDNPKKARTIADNSAKVLRDQYLTPAAEACYWRRLIKGYGSVSFEPDFYEADNKTWRGVPFDSVALTRKVRWDAH